jgi:hypothetical protein
MERVKGVSDLLAILIMCRYSLILMMDEWVSKGDIYREGRGWVC